MKFTYFDAKGRGELSRLILAHGKIPYEDRRVSMEEWPALKPKMPLNVMPVLEYDGETISQSKTIARFLAKEVGIDGKTHVEQAKADMIVDCVKDIEDARYTWVFQQDPSIREKNKTKFEKETLPKFLHQMMMLLQQSSGKFMVGDELTWADIALAGFLDLSLPGANLDGIEQFKPLTDLMKRVFNTQNIKTYLETRPKSLF